MAILHFFSFFFLCGLSRAMTIEETVHEKNNFTGTAPRHGEEEGQDLSLILGGWCPTKTGPVLVHHETVDAKDKPRGSLYLGGNIRDLETENDFGIISHQKWTQALDSKNVIDIMYWKTISEGCTDLTSCKEKTKIHLQRGRHLLDNFHILPDGTILEGLGWEKLYSDYYRVNLFMDNESDFPSIDALVSLNYLVQAAVGLGKLRMDFRLLYPPHSNPKVDEEVSRWVTKKRISFNENTLLSRVSLYDTRVISRLEWRAMLPIREFKRAKGRAEVVEVRVTPSGILIPEDSSQYVRDMQQQQMPTHSDIFANFIIGRDGRVYEGLGWNWSRKENVVFFEILSGGELYAPWTHLLAAFTLQLREGVDKGWISEKYTINVASNVSHTISDRIITWGEWGRHTEKKNVYLETCGEEERLVTNEDTGDVAGQRNAVALVYPASAIYFTQSYGGCSKQVDCLPFYKNFGGKTLRSKHQVKSNFYFVDDGEGLQVAHEGLGWDRTTRENEVVFEFLTPDANTLPSNRSMIESIFLIREGLSNGALRRHTRIIVAGRTSIAFENLVRFWETTLRKSSIL